MKNIPQSGQVRRGDSVNVIGAGGPMGVMHVIRNICQGTRDVKVFAADLDDERLAVLEKIAAPVAKKHNVEFKTFNSAKQQPPSSCSYIIIMAPVAKIVSDAIKKAGENAIINIFAGIPANITAQIDLSKYIEKKLYLMGTSGSSVNDMKTVLDKVQSERLNTNLSVGAISGLVGAIDGIKAVENRTIHGKIVVYPQLADLELISLDKLTQKLPDVAKNLDNGFWCKKAEDALLKHGVS
jgi:threonine dehydrogenase-like Zn-dependent dehydrogenase